MIKTYIAKRPGAKYVINEADPEDMITAAEAELLSFPVKLVEPKRAVQDPVAPGLYMTPDGTMTPDQAVAAGYTLQACTSISEARSFGFNCKAWDSIERARAAPSTWGKTPTVPAPISLPAQARQYVEERNEPTQAEVERCEHITWAHQVRALPEAAGKPASVKALLDGYGPKSKDLASCARLLRGMPIESAGVVTISRPVRAAPVEDPDGVRLRRSVELAIAGLSHRADRGDRNVRDELLKLRLSLANAREGETPLAEAMTAFGLDPKSYMKGDPQ